MDLEPSFLPIVFYSAVYISIKYFETEKQAHEISWDAVFAQFICQDVLLIQ